MTASAPDPGTAPDPDADRDVPDTDRDPGPGASPPVELSARARAVLALERRPWAGPGAKERAIREELGISPVRYFQLLDALIEDERALREDPVTVNRLRRLKEERRGRR
ncbi:hypothetical protein B7C62_19620 [Kitasatospora albolonga]|uniref:DUF3263 domain-containing protein n=1 Tax=Kitasatospora albolonga TaxID=68173 RepID=A0ABC8BVJ6_9ACTN|nr:hypothetical protein B7C62_19620 [Kitasatospora albolonga]